MSGPAPRTLTDAELKAWFAGYKAGREAEASAAPEPPASLVEALATALHDFAWDPNDAAAFAQSLAAHPALRAAPLADERLRAALQQEFEALADLWDAAPSGTPEGETYHSAAAQLRSSWRAALREVYG